MKNFTERETVIGFGKHKGLTVSEILEVDPSYIIWLHENTEISFRNGVIREATEADYEDHPCIGDAYDGWGDRD